MAKILILFGTDHGHTRKIANRMADVIRERGHEVELVQGNKAPSDFSPDGFDATVIGTSVHMDLHQISVRKLVKEKLSAFERIPSAYFCVCLTAFGTRPQDMAQVKRYINDFTKYTGLNPIKVTAFAGALKYPDYNFVRRFIAKLVARRVGADTNTKGEYEYTDWDTVTRFAEEFADSLETQDGARQT
ncbi:MAG: flavodoxin domain-containing protein [Chloroflexota bacterium]|nr:flavodoxin domain-containing protein [Chloroflexota bacterium]